MTCIVFNTTVTALSITSRQRILSKLPLSKQQEILAKKQTIAQDASLVGYGLLYYGLKNHFNISDQVSVIVDYDGKPQIEGNSHLHFNISHSINHVACAISDSPVGVDIECFRPVSDALAKRVMTSHEYQQYKTTRNPQHYFFQIWTLKESYMKYTGEGMRMALKMMDFDISDNQIKSNIPNVIFTNKLIDHECILAVCSKSPVDFYHFDQTILFSSDGD